MPRFFVKISDTVVLGFPDQFLVPSLPVVDLCWLSLTHSQCSRVFCLLQATQTVDHFQQILDHLWSICATLFASKTFWIIWIAPTEECSNLMLNLRQIYCSACSVLLNATATQYTSSLSSIYHPHWLVQWSHHCSHMRIPAHSPWLPGYINVMQTIFVILTMVGLLLDRPLYIISYIYFI